MRHFVSLPYKLSLCDLGSFEDLYYAACAKLKDFTQQTNTLLENGFKHPSDIYVRYTKAPLNTLGSISLVSFKKFLGDQEDMLLGPGLTHLLDAGIRCTFSSVDTAVSGDEKTLRAHSEALRPGLCAAPTARVICTRVWLKTLTHLCDVTTMSSGMLSAHLTEKHLFSKCAKVHTQATKSTSWQSANYTPYVSPYNLNERAKKLNDPQAPELPCICDPECICTPLCAIDPTRNCLCEENGLFTRVTEGMNIDDLDVPDLVRERRAASEFSQSDSEADNTCEKSTLEVGSSLMADAGSPTGGKAILTEINAQLAQQKAHLLPNFDFSGLMGFKALPPDSNVLGHGFPSHGGPAFSPRHDFVDDQLAKISAYHAALKHPFSEQCDTPPKRPSRRSVISGQLFSSKRDKVSGGKRKLRAVSLLSDIANDAGIVKPSQRRSISEVLVPSFTP